MPELVNLRMEFGIKFDPILEMAQIGRSLATPFLRDGEAGVNNENKASERLSLRFKSRGYVLEFDWTHIIFAAEGPRNDLREPGGPTKIFFELLDEIKSRFSSFRIRQFLLRSFWIWPDGPATAYEFKSTYITSSLGISSQLDDIAIKLIYGIDEDEKYEFLLGPYRGEDDIKNHKINLFDVIPGSWKDLTGTLVKSEYVRDSPREFSREQYLRFSEHVENMTEQCLQ